MVILRRIKINFPLTHKCRPTTLNESSFLALLAISSFRSSSKSLLPLDSANVGADAILPEALACDTGELGRVIAALWDTFLMLSRLKKIVIVVASIDELVVCRLIL